MAAAHRWTCLLLIALLCACNEHKANDLATHNMSPRETLCRAEELMQTRPDSALMLLEDLSKGALRGRENRAHFALLYSQALDKNYIDLANDSIIRVAVDYYAPRKDNNRKMLSYYYLGRVQYNAKEYQKAIISFTIAEKIAQKTHESFYLGQIYNNMMMIWNKTYNNDEELSCAKLSYKSYFQDDSVSIYTHYALLSVGVALHNSRNFQEAEHYCNQAEAIARQIKDTVFLSTCLIEKCNLLLIQPSRCFEAKEYIIELKKILHDNLPADLIAGYAYILSMENEIDSVSAYMEQALSISMDSIKLSKVKHYQYLINKAISNEQEALRLFEEIVETQNIKVEDLLDESVARYQRDYFQTESELNELKLQHNKQKQIFVSIILIIIMLSAIVFVRQRLKAKAQEINQYLDKVQDLESELLIKERNLQAVSESNSQMNEQINLLFAKQFATIDQLSATYYEMHAVKNEKEAVYKSVKKEIENFSKNKKTLQELENIVNQHKNNVMAVLREEFPEFSEMDFRLICYSIAGFSAKAISVFTGNSTGNIYMKKSRLKAKINASDIAQKETIIKALD